MNEKIRLLTIVVFKMFFGFLLFSLGSVLIINSKIGVAPWDVLHQGLANLFNIGVGRAMIYSGLLIAIIAAGLGQMIGWATILNMFMIGIFVDFLMDYNILPSFQSCPIRLIMIIPGIVAQGLGTYFYISKGYGAGPRDGLMVGLTRKLQRPFGLVKSIIEVSAVASGFLLGGNFGIGTLIMAFGAGHIWQYMYKKMNFDISSIEHSYIQDDIKYIKNKYSNTEPPQ